MSWQQLNCDLENSRAIKEARNKALDEARMAVSIALSIYSCTCLNRAETAILALKVPTP